MQFKLTPFSSAPLFSSVAITGSVTCQGRLLRTDYLLTGDLSGVVLPAQTAAPARQDGLWRATCFELFAALPGQPGYLEVNLSPSRDWNAYSFTGYREGMAPFAMADFRSWVDTLRTDNLALSFEMSLLEEIGAVEVAVSAVLEHTTGTRSYWALVHPGDQPDFHDRRGFLLRLLWNEEKRKHP